MFRLFHFQTCCLSCVLAILSSNSLANILLSRSCYFHNHLIFLWRPRLVLRNCFPVVLSFHAHSSNVPLLFPKSHDFHPIHSLKAPITMWLRARRPAIEHVLGDVWSEGRREPDVTGLGKLLGLGNMLLGVGEDVTAQRTLDGS